jgi:hypothetical protein
MRTLVYIAHPVSGLTRAELTESVSAWLAQLIGDYPEHAFCVSWLPYVLALDDGNQTHRERGMRDDLECLSRCDEIWLLGPRISSGMLDEAHFAVLHDMPVWRVQRVLNVTNREEWRP